MKHAIGYVFLTDFSWIVKTNFNSMSDTFAADCATPFSETLTRWVIGRFVWFSVTSIYSNISLDIAGNLGWMSPTGSSRTVPLSFVLSHSHPKTRIIQCDYNDCYLQHSYVLSQNTYMHVLLTWIIGPPLRVSEWVLLHRRFARETRSY